MTTTWTITLPDGGTLTVTADEITTRTDGSLWLLQALDPKPAPLVPVLILAAGRWFSIEPWHD
jgi:hypothetical protein